MTDPAFKAMSVEEYLHTEVSSPVKREYVHGFVYPLHAQAGTTAAHATITGNIFAALRGMARPRGCVAFMSDIRVTTADRFAYYYPDVLVTCEEHGESALFMGSPCILVEVLSPSTAHNDHNAKYHAYTALPSLHTYLIVEQAERRVYAYQRTAPGWEMRQFSGLDRIPLACLDAELTLDDVYDGVRPMPSPEA